MLEHGDDPSVMADRGAALGADLVRAWGSWAPAPAPDGHRFAYISDRSGEPAVWLQQLGGDESPRMLRLAAGPAVAVSWSPDGTWLACLVATAGVRTEVWRMRPDGSEARRLAGDAGQQAELGPWVAADGRVAITLPPASPGSRTRICLADPATGVLECVAEAALAQLLGASHDARILALSEGPRGRQMPVLVDRMTGARQETSPGATPTAVMIGDPLEPVVYLVTDAGADRQRLIRLGLGDSGSVTVVAAAPDADLEAIAASPVGDTMLLIWNASGVSRLELLTLRTGARVPVPCPGVVAYAPRFAADGSFALVALEDPEHPPAVWRLDLAQRTWEQVTPAPPVPTALVHPTLEQFTGEDGTPLTGWLYRAESAGPDAPAVVYLHGGPESQELPAFAPQHQALAAAGISVLAANIRGSSGFGRRFREADDRHGRFAAIADVRAAAAHLSAAGIAAPDRIAVAGRSYGGYLVLASLTFSPGVFAAGVDICGMSDLRTFYRDTEHWIGAAAVTKYGDPAADADLLEAISPLPHVDAIDVPLLVVHGDLDTNVPLGEARQVVAALTARDRPVSYLELPGEGHEYRRVDSRIRLVGAIVGFLTAALGEATDSRRDPMALPPASA